jgi:type III restriction enzyme
MGTGSSGCSTARRRDQVPASSISAAARPHCGESIASASTPAGRSPSRTSHSAAGYVSSSNGVRLAIGEERGGHADQVMQAQVRETVKQHLEKELAIHESLGADVMKVLSLFFLDRVSNYDAPDGKVRRWFADAFQELTALDRYSSLPRWPLEAVHGGYFARDRGQAIDSTGKTAADDDAYRLIMQDKEELLRPEQPLRFIFSHSALREGWDNPNIFQICTLNETRSPVRMRQEIGRGMRLPVLASGERCFDRGLNRLTVVANEQYEEFVKTLQTQIREDFGVEFGDRVQNARARRTAQLKDGWATDPDFVALWNQIKHRTRYSVAYRSEDLVARAATLVHAMKPISAPQITMTTVRLGLEADEITPTVVATRAIEVEGVGSLVPDILSFLQRETELTRTTLAEILVASGRLSDAPKNPQQFLDQALRAIRAALEELMVDGVKYERIAGVEWEMRLFDSADLVGYESRMVEVKRSIYDALELESGPERRFAAALDERDDIRLFVKLPRWFKVETPIGTYNPDWAIVKQEERLKLYLVRETKSTRDEYRLRQGEWAKIRCGMAHFGVLGVNFDFAASPNEV